MNKQIQWTYWLPFTLLGLVGCSSQSTLNEVNGKILLKNQPLGGAQVSLIAENPSDRATDFPIGETSADGTFRLKTGEAIGAPAGKYKVTVVCPEAPSKPQGMSMGELDRVDKLKGLYADPATSKIVVEVKEGTNELDPINLN